MTETFALVAGQSALPWTVAPLANGGVQLEWKGPEGALEVEISPDGRLGYLLEVGQGADSSVQEGDDIADEHIERLLSFVLGMRNAR